MSSNQEARQTELRAQTSTTENIAGDWHALWDAQSIAPGGTFNERMLAWINDQLSTSYTNLNGAMYAYASDQSFNRWNDVGAGVDLSDATP